MLDLDRSENPVFLGSHAVLVFNGSASLASNQWERIRIPRTASYRLNGFQHHTVMESKVCNICKLLKSVDEFHFKDKKKGYRRDRCKTCAATYHKAHYEQNKDAYLAARDRRRTTMASWVQKLKEEPCTDCQKTYPFYVMQFDHVRGDKVDAVSKLMTHSVSRKVIEAEIAKCELVCANCHAIRTYKRVNP